MSLLAWKNEFFNPTENLQIMKERSQDSNSLHATSDKQRNSHNYWLTYMNKKVIISWMYGSRHVHF